jgi:hypothetical protein
MFFKKKKKIIIDTNCIKQEIMNWIVNQNVEIQLIEIFLGDYRDGNEDKIGIMVLFKTNVELEKYKENGFISELKLEAMRLLKDTVLNQNKQIDFVFDVFSNHNIYFKSRRTS